MAVIKSDAAIAATPANQSPVAAARPQQAGAVAPAMPPKDILIIRQNAMSNAMSSPVVAALAVTAVTEKEQMDLVVRWAELSEKFVTRPYAPLEVPF